ncbi:MAG TPA: endopeptidase La [Candidatus Eubacterium pullicola]|uniref:Lon protease n=1 Tax=Gallibacter intestinalis TaxID=2779356 RepID=A0ABR9QWM5_9FIRM|nr:endopeptidase La [Gallibacter intestinalis]MBE5035261.1 endopeptidase La [Gallibacter intestinalis]HIW39809.1 endopeptidase La [Candidatus Eubacterium pullicola]
MNYPMIPLRGLSIFPHMVLHFDIGREKSINALEQAMIRDQYVFLASQKDENTDLPTADDFYHVGTVAKVKQMLKLPGDTIRVLVEGVARGKIIEMIQDDPYFECEVDEDIEQDTAEEDQEREEALIRMTLAAFEEYAALSEKTPKEVFHSVAGIQRGGALADAIAGHMKLSVEDNQKVLEALEPCERLETVYTLLVREIEIMGIELDINRKVKEQMSQNQREYYLKEQMRAIQGELGFDDDLDDEIIKWHEQMDELELPADICEKLEKEINRLNRMQPTSAEAGVIRTYIETILALPWNKLSEEHIDLKEAEKILDEDHYGLEKVKERVLEYLAVVELSHEIKGPIICLVGPPGTGKTSIAKSIARATGREFVRMSLGGVRDEAEIRGHRRTYIGAIPGRVINSIKDAGTRNPLFLFDEVDKLGSDFKGDPSSALLEVLDPEQNKDFTDHYLEVPFDLSKVMFITTANSLNTIPGPLLDRMEVIEVTGYTEEEKLQIAKKYLIPKKTKEHGLEKSQFKMTDKAIRDLINYYTRESGVRNLEREIANLVRKVARKVVTDGIEGYKVGPKDLEELLGKKRYRYDKISGKSEVGVVTGLAWTVVGGDTLFIETSAVPGTGKLQLTGQLGDVMQESARTGISYIRSVAHKHGIDENFYKEKDIHIHVPEGAVPKDGPSAGVTMCVAMISTLTGIPVRKDVAMTGEVTLRGNVLPVGGIKEKVLAAHRAGVRTVLLPFENERDIDEIPENVREQMNFVLIKNVDEALKEALVK